jgi:hypothetical protein
MERELPAVRTVGIQEFGHSYGQLWHELPAGGVIRLISFRPGRHRCWIAPQPPPGCEPVQVSVFGFARHLGRYLDEIRGGAVIEIYDSVRRVTRGFAFWAATDDLAGLDAVIPYMVRTRTGRVIQHEMFPLAVQAERPAGRRRAVLAHA